MSRDVLALDRIFTGEKTGPCVAAGTGRGRGAVHELPGGNIMVSRLGRLILAPWRL